MEGFVVGCKVEALDDGNWWTKGIVKEVIENEGTYMYLVGFDGWSAKWERAVNEKEIRHPTTVRFNFLCMKFRT